MDEGEVPVLRRGAAGAQHRASKGRVETRKNDLFVSYC
jgi:hypothetical protein